MDLRIASTLTALLMIAGLVVTAGPVVADDDPPAHVCVLQKCNETLPQLACVYVFGHQVQCVPDPCDDQACF